MLFELGLCPCRDNVVVQLHLQFCIELALDHELAHRDIKLENTLLDEDGYVKIIDYGLSKKIDAKKLMQTKVGTPEYIAPEVCDVTARTHDS